MKILAVCAIAVLGVFGVANAQSAAPPPPAVTQPCAAPEYRQLDFWTGDWDAAFDAGDGKIGHATNHITKDEYGSCVITEHFYQADIDYKGHSVSMYDKPSKTWKQTWVDNSGVFLYLVGGPVTGQKHIFELRTVEPRGATKEMYRMIWEDVKADSFTWRWQKRVTETDPWEDSWLIHYTRKKPA